MEIVDLCKNPNVLNDLLQGQEDALKAFGIRAKVIADSDRVIQAGTFGVIAKTDEGRIIGGLRMYSKHPGKPLPIESEESPIPPEYRPRLNLDSSFWEFRGLWVDPHFTGDSLGQKLLKFATASAFELGCETAIAVTHSRIFDHTCSKAGFEVYKTIPDFEYPNKNYKSLVIFNRCEATQ